MDKKQWITTAAGVEMPPMIYGTAWKKERTADLVVQAVKAGFRGIDTACQPKHYEEPLVGEALKRLEAEGINRDDLFLQTKFTPLPGQDPMRVPYDPNASMEEQVAQSFRSSQRNLQSEYVDSLVLHSPVFPKALLLRVWNAMEKVYGEGGARQLGISNCYDLDVLQMLYDNADVKPAVVQNRFYAENGYDRELREWCKESGIVYQSFWTLTANPHILGSELIRNLAMKHGKTEAQIFFRALSRMGIVPLTGTTSPRHMEEDLGIFAFDLTREEVEEVAARLS